MSLEDELKKAKEERKKAAATQHENERKSQRPTINIRERELKLYNMIPKNMYITNKSRDEK